MSSPLSSPVVMIVFFAIKPAVTSAIPPIAENTSG